MADLKTTNIYGDAYINNKVGIATNAPATRLQIGQLLPTAATEGIQFGDDTSARIYRDSSTLIKVSGGFTSTTFINAGNYLQTSGNLIYPASQTATQRLEVGNASGNAWIDGLTIAQGGNVTVYNNLTVNNAATVTNDLTVNGNTYLGNAGGDTVFVNDIIRIGATDSGDASLFFGEGSVAGSDYGARWYWDSGYTFTWYTRNAGTDTALFDYVTNDTTYLNWRRHFHMQNKEINYNAQIHFNAGTRFVGEGTNYLIFRSDATNAGGIRVQDGGITTKGYIGYWDSAGGGILNNTGNWAVRYNFGNTNSGGTLFGAWVVNGNISATNLSGTNTGDQSIGNGTITIAAGTGIGVGTSNTFTTNQSGATTVTVTNSGVTSAVAGTGVGVSAATGAVTFSIGQAVGTANSPTFATLQLTRLNFGATGAAPYAAAAGEGTGNGITFGGDEGGPAYRIFTGMENIGGNYSKLTLNWHTGIRIGAYFGYGGIRFYNNSVGSGTEIFSVGNLDSNVRVVNNLIVNGKVGIGTTNPTYKLQIGTVGSLDDSIRIGTYAVAKNTRQYIGNTREDSGLFEQAGNGDSPSTVLGGVAGIRIVNTTGTLASAQADNSVQLLTHIYNGGSQVALHANYNGNVGIGSTSPAYKLDVSGTGRFTGDLTVGTVVGTANSATLYANPSSYGSWKIGGTRNGWYGIEFESGTNLMANSNEVGFHRNGSGWQMRWSAGVGYVYKGNPGGGTEAVILDSSNSPYANNMNQYVRTTDSPTFVGLSLTSVSTTGATITNLTGAYQNTTVYDSAKTQSATPSRGIRAPASSIQFTDSYAIAPFYTYRSTGDWPVPYGIGWGTGGESSGIFQRYASNGSSFGDMIFYTGNDGSGAFSFRRHTWEGTTHFAAGSGELNTELFRVDWAGKATATSFALPGGFTITDPGSGYAAFSNWVLLGTTGFYSSTNSAHLLPNPGTYGSWKITGTRGGWHGIEFDSGTILMANSSESGFYRVGSGWQMWWSGGTGYVQKGGSGGGTQATILESSNYTSYTPGLGTNNTLTGINTINNTSNTVINTLSGNLGLTMYQATAGTDAYMTFHIGGDYAAYFGLGGAENDLVYGGWSVGNVRYRILHSGNATYAWNMNQFVRTTDTPTFSELTLSGQGMGAYNLMKYSGIRSGDWQTFTNTQGQLNVIEVHNIANGAHTNYPTGVYTYGAVMSWRASSHSFQLYASHTGDLAYKTQWGNDNYSGWRRILDSTNYIHAANMNQYVRTTDAPTFAGATFTTTSDYQITLNGGGTTWAGINWVDVNGSDQIYFNGQNKTFSIGGG